MTRNQWTIIVALAVGVVLEFCAIGFLFLNRIQGPAQENTAALLTTQVPTGVPTDTATPTPTPTRTATPLPSLTPTFVLMGKGPWTLPTTSGLHTPAPRLAGPTRTRVPGPISDAWDKVGSAKALRFELEISAQGNFGTIPGLGGQNGSPLMLSLSGATNGQDSDLSFKGFLATMIGGDASQGLELMTVGNKLYVHGPAPMFGAPAAKWYVGQNDSKTGPSVLPKTDSMTNSFKGENPDWTKFAKTGKEKFDGQSCDVYTADRAAALAFFQSLDTTQLPSGDSLQGLDAADASLWICADGYVHQLKLDLSAHSPDKPAEAVELQIRFHLSDLNGKITITPPKDATPLEAPDLFKFRTPFPTN